MSTELEQRLERALSRLPRPGGDAQERARAAALATLPPVHEPLRHARRTIVLAAATVAVLVAVAAGLAATGTVTFAVRSSKPAPPHLVLPARSDGVAAFVDGRLWLLTRGGARIEGLRASAAALSPHALYVAVGLGRSLVAMAPNGRTAWAHETRGEVEAIAWAPDGLRIAYVVRVARGFELRTIEGDGDHDRLLDTSVRPSRPSWRPDSLALAYVGAGGHVVVYDFGHASRKALRSSTLPWTRGLGSFRTIRTPDATRLVWAHAGREADVFRGGPRVSIRAVDVR